MKVKGNKDHARPGYGLVDSREARQEAFRRNPRLKELSEKAGPAFDAISAFIRLRLENKITQKQLEGLTRIQQASISRFERGGAPHFTLDFIAKLVRPMGYQPKIIFEKVAA